MTAISVAQACRVIELALHDIFKWERNQFDAEGHQQFKGNPESTWKSIASFLSAGSWLGRYSTRSGQIPSGFAMA